MIFDLPQVIRQSPERLKTLALLRSAPTNAKPRSFPDKRRQLGTSELIA